MHVRTDSQARPPHPHFSFSWLIDMKLLAVWWWRGEKERDLGGTQDPGRHSLRYSALWDCCQGLCPSPGPWV